MDLTADRVTLKRLFGLTGEQFRIPPYQRPYAWEHDQIDDLWDDITSTMGSGHFLGTIVLNNQDDSRPEVIDGQQRLTSLAMLLGLIRDEYAELGDRNAHRVQDLLTADSYANGDAQFKIRSGTANWGPLRDFCLRALEDPDRLQWHQVDGLAEDVRARNRRLFDNAARLKDKLEQYLGDTDGEKRLAKLRRLEETLIKDLDLVVIRVGTAADAFLLFETLNDRGLQLSAADLLKNHLLARTAEYASSSRQVEEAAAEWDALLGDLGSGVDVTRFLRHYLLIDEKRVRKDDVFDRFKARVEREGPDNMIRELHAYGRLYGGFEDPSRVSDPEVADVLQDLKTLRAQTCYSALMPARRFLSTKDFIQFARLAERLTYRYSSVVGLDSKELERVYGDAAKIIADSEGELVEEASRVLIKASPDGDLFKNAFMRMEMGRHYLVRYTLGRVEEHLSGEREKQLRPNAKVHIEHIMPRTLTDEWRLSLGERLDEHPEQVNRYGNLTLLYRSLNIVASNSPFWRKKAEYRHSEVHLTRRLCESDRWTFEEIESRQTWLAEVADRIWGIEATSAEFPDHPVSQQELEDLLPSDLADVVRELIVETTAEEAVTLAGLIDSHVAQLGDTGDSSESVEVARQLGDVLKTLVRDSDHLDARGRAYLRGAVGYFVLSDDALPDSDEGGLEDDRLVVRSICEMLGRPELAMSLSVSG